MASLFRQLSRTNSRTRKSKESHAKEELEEVDEEEQAEFVHLGGVRPSQQHRASGGSVFHRLSMRPSTSQAASSSSSHGPKRISIVAAPKQHGEHAARLPMAPLHPLTREAAAEIFRGATRSATLSRAEFKDAIEAMMRQKLVPYLIEQVRAWMMAAAATGTISRTPLLFPLSLTPLSYTRALRSSTTRTLTPSLPRPQRAPKPAGSRPSSAGSTSSTNIY